MSEQLPGGLPGGSPTSAAEDREAAVETASDTSQELFSATHSEAADWADANEQQGHEAEIDETARQDDAPDTTAHNNADEEHTAEENPVDTPNIASVDADRSTEEAPVASAEETAAAPGNAEPNSENKESSQEQNTDAPDEASSKPTAASEGTDAAPESTADADFDDFGDFEEGEFEQTPAPAPARESEPVEASAPVDPGVKPLEIDGQSAESIATQVRELLPTDFGVNAPELGQEDIRQVEGLSQVLVTESSRTLFRELHGEESLPTQMLSWKRSQTRRQQLIALGVPINLDEVLGGDAQQKELPPLELHVESAPAPVPAPEAAAAAAASVPASDTPESSVQAPESAPVPGERLGDRRRRELGVNVPFVDSERIEQITRLTEDDLKLQSLPALRSLVKELQALSTQTTELLAYHLMLRDMFTADSDMYNTMIKDLVAGASTRVASRKRGSLSFMSRSSRPGTPTGRNTPT